MQRGSSCPGQASGPDPAQARAGRQQEVGDTPEVQLLEGLDVAQRGGDGDQQVGGGVQARQLGQAGQGGGQLGQPVGAQHLRGQPGGADAQAVPGPGRLPGAASGCLTAQQVPVQRLRGTVGAAKCMLRCGCMPCRLGRSAANIGPSCNAWRARGSSPRPPVAQQAGGEASSLGRGEAHTRRVRAVQSPRL